MVQQAILKRNPTPKATLPAEDRYLLLQIVGQRGAARANKIQDAQEKILHFFRKSATARKHGKGKSAETYYERAATLKAALTSTLRDLRETEQGLEEQAIQAASRIPTLPPIPALHPWEPDSYERIHTGYADCF